MFRLQDDFTYLMPSIFYGSKFDAEQLGKGREMNLTISYETDRAQLENYIPEEFELLTPEITVGFAQNTEIDYLEGGSYNVIAVGAPVRFHGKKDQLDGAYQLVMWENKTAPIVMGREQDGVPKIYADINLRAMPPRYRVTASEEGQTFLTMDFESTGPITGQELDSMNAQKRSINCIGWRYIPKVGAPGAELSQFILYPMSGELESAQAGNGSLEWIKPPEQISTQFPIDISLPAKSLASLPIKKVTRAVLTKGMYALHPFSSRVIE